MNGGERRRGRRRRARGRREKSAQRSSAVSAQGQDLAVVVPVVGIPLVFRPTRGRRSRQVRVAGVDYEPVVKTRGVAHEGEMRHRDGLAADQGERQCTGEQPRRESTLSACNHGAKTLGEVTYR
jgi:hypothetical protein